MSYKNIANRTYDVATLLHDGAAAATATGKGQVDGSAQVLDLGAEVFRDDWAGEPRMAADLLIDISAIDETTGDETYELEVELSEDEAFTTPVSLCKIEIDATGRHILPIRAEKYGTAYRYIRIGHNLAGTTPSITYEARLAIMESPH